MTMLDMLLDTILPGDADYPSASDTALSARLEGHDRFGPLTAAITILLPDDFIALADTERTASIAGLEAAHPGDFAAFITGVYSLYYSDPAVLAVIARTIGYTPHAPQPAGYTLAPFDPAILTTVAARQRHYRDIGDAE